MRFLWLAVSLAACRAPEDPPKADPSTPEPSPSSTPQTSTPQTSPGTDGEPAPIEDAPLFDPDHVVEVEITLDPDDWAELRGQTRSLVDVLSGDCLAQPFPSPFTEFRADVVVDGEALSDVGLSKKGFIGSLSWDKPSLKIDTDAFEDQELANGTERITLNNGQQDPSLVQTCLGYGVFRAAGLPAPRCNFAHVVVNGEDLGVYAHVEAVKKDMLRRHFARSDGDLYEGTLSDFVPGWTGTFDAKTDETDPELGPVLALTEALELADDALLDALDPLLDLDQFVRFWATEALIAHWDGYASNTNNFFVYRDPTDDRLRFLPWGDDAVFEDPATPTVATTGWLAARLWNLPEIRAAYFDALDDLLQTAWDEDALLSEVDRMQALIAPLVADPALTAAGAERVRAFVAARRTALADQRAAALATDAPTASRTADTWCLADRGPISVDFAARWGTIEADPFVEGDAQFGGGTLPPLPYGGAVAGYDGYGSPLVAAFGVDGALSELYEVVVYLPGPPAPGELPLDFGAGGTALLVRLDLTVPYSEGEVLGLVDGTLILTAAGDGPDDPIEGHIEGRWLEGLF